MKVLNTQSLCEAMTRCYENQRYKTCVAFVSSLSFIPFVDELKACAVKKTIPGVAKIQCTHFNARMMFVNGSCVEVFIVTPNVRGKRCNELLYEKGLSEEIINSVLQPMLVTYRDVQNGAVECAGDEDGMDELDEFLKSFKTIPSSVAPQHRKVNENTVLYT